MSDLLSTDVAVTILVSVYRRKHTADYTFSSLLHTYLYIQEVTYYKQMVPFS